MPTKKLHLNCHEFELFLHSRIPVTKAMGITVLKYDPQSVQVSAPLALNFNHKGTAFGGSINTVMTVCGWAQTHAIISRHDADAHIVIQRSQIKYRAPITSDIIAECKIEDPSAVRRLIESYKKYGKGKIDIQVKCMDGDKVLAEFEAGYVVFNSLVIKS